MKYFVVLIFCPLIAKSVSNKGTHFKINSGLNGHWSYYKCDFSLYPTNNPYGMGVLALHAHEFFDLPKENVLKFMSVDTRPHLFVERDKIGFKIWGPLYSIVHEAAQYINYSIEGIHLKNEDMKAAFAIYKPDFIISVIHPLLDLVKILNDDKSVKLATALFGKKFGEITKVIGEEGLNAILYWTRPPHQSLFSFVNIFDTQTWICIVTAIAVIVLITRNSKVTWTGWTFLILTSTFNLSFEVNRLRRHLMKTQLAVLMTWMATCMLLEVMFGGDMLATLAKEVKPIVINSLEDLKDESIGIRTVDINIVTRKENDSGEADKSELNYVPSYLVDRVEYFTQEETLDKFVAMRNVFGTVESPKKDSCFMHAKSLLSYMKTHYEGGRLDLSTHVSDSSEPQFHFFVSSFIAENKELIAMDYVITHLKEAGIYQKWLDVATYGLNKTEMKPLIVSYKVAKLNCFEGPIYICCGVLVISLIVALGERYGYLNKSKKTFKKNYNKAKGDKKILIPKPILWKIEELNEV